MIKDLQDAHKQSREELTAEHKNKMLEAEQKYLNFMADIKPIKKAKNSLFFKILILVNNFD